MADRANPGLRVYTTSGPVKPTRDDPLGAREHSSFYPYPRHEEIDEQVEKTVDILAPGTIITRE